MTSADTNSDWLEWEEIVSDWLQWNFGMSRLCPNIQSTFSYGDFIQAWPELWSVTHDSQGSQSDWVLYELKTHF